MDAKKRAPGPNGCLLVDTCNGVFPTRAEKYKERVMSQRGGGSCYGCHCLVCPGDGLVDIDLTTGALTLIGTFGLFDFERAYAEATGSENFFGQLEPIRLASLAEDPITGRMIGGAKRWEALFEVDKVRCGGGVVSCDVCAVWCAVCVPVHLSLSLSHALCMCV